MDTILRPLIEEHLRAKLQQVCEQNINLANSLHDEDLVSVLSDCKNKVNTLFSSENNQPLSLLLIVEDADQLIYQMDHYQEQLSKKIKKNSPIHTQEDRDRTKQSIEEAKELLNFCRQHQENTSGAGKNEEEEEALCRRIRQELKNELKAPCTVYSDVEFLNGLGHWICKLDVPVIKQKFISPELAKDFLGKLQADIPRLSISLKDNEDQQEALANMLQIREALSSLQTALLNRVYTERQTVFSK